MSPQGPWNSAELGVVGISQPQDGALNALELVGRKTALLDLTIESGTIIRRISVTSGGSHHDENGACR